jgi:3-dehydroshikimate dehydratase
MLRLAAFADEISPDLDTQIAHCRKNGVTHFELRGVAGKNVLDFDAALRAEIKRKLTDAGMGVASIGSPVGKTKLGEPWFDRFKIAVDAAEFFDAPFIRIFSYYEATDRAEVMRRMQKKIDYLAGRSPVLVHENEKDIYGERGANCLDLMQTIDSPKLRFAFDFANFVQAGDNPLDDWPSLKPYTVHLHIKDALAATGQVVPAGQGDGRIAEILKDAYASGYRGFLSLEPHLAHAGPFGGFTGPEQFKVAADALKKLCRENGISLACDRS